MKKLLVVLALLFTGFGMLLLPSVSALTMDVFSQEDGTVGSDSFSYTKTIPANSGIYYLIVDFTSSDYSINQWGEDEQSGEDLYIYITGYSDFEGAPSDVFYQASALSTIFGSAVTFPEYGKMQIELPSNPSSVTVAVGLSYRSAPFSSTDFEYYGIGDIIFSLETSTDTIPPSYTYSNLSIDTPYYDLVTEAEIRANLAATDPEEGDVTSRIQVYNDHYTNEDIVVGGDYYIMYMVDDTAGNSAYLQVDINVIDDLKPYFVQIDPNSGDGGEEGGSYSPLTGDDASLFTTYQEFVDGDVVSFSWVEGDFAGSEAEIFLSYFYPYDDYSKLWTYDEVGWSIAYSTDPTGDLFWNPDVQSVGTYQEIVTVTDPNGNSASLTVNYEIIFNTPPVINGDSEIDVEITTYDLQAVLALYTATDAEDGSTTVSIQSTTLPDTPVLGQSYTLVLEATDYFGKTTTKSITVNIVDTTIPVFKIDNIAVSSYTQTVNMSNTAALQTLIDSIVVTDAYYGIITSSMVVPAFPSFAVPGSTVMTITCTDASGNQATLALTVVVVDNIAPVINGATKIVKGITATLTLSDITAELTATDNVDGIISVQVVSDGYSGNNLVIGSYLVKYKATDSSGNITYHDVRIWVVDNQAPAWIYNDFFVNLSMNESMTRTELVSLLQSSGMIGSDISYTVTFVTDEYTGNEDIAGAYSVVMNIVYEDGSEESIAVQLTVPEAESGDDVIVVTPEEDLTGFQRTINWVATAAVNTWNAIKAAGSWIGEKATWTYDHILKPAWDFFFVKDTDTEIPEYTTTEPESVTTTLSQTTNDITWATYIG